MNNILSMSQEEILAWLQQNSEEYLNSTDSTREQMSSGWEETLNTMNGIVVTHWDEVYDIISRGQDYVINFLKENSAEYAEASRLQQEAYIDGWQEKFDAIAKAYQIMTTQILDTSSFINTTELLQGSSSTTGGGGSRGGGGGSGSGGKTGSGDEEE